MATPNDTTKVCTKCNGEYPATTEYFTKSNRHKNGLNHICKVCKNAYQRSHFDKHQDEILDRNNKWRKSHPDKWRASRKDGANDKHRQAHVAVSQAVAKHLLPNIKTQVCANCGKQATHYHHRSYEPKHWLDVTPYCPRCHKLVHKGKIE